MKKWWQKILWPLIKLLGLRKWFAGDAEYPTPDDWRNPFWRWTEAHAIKPVQSAYVYDLRLGFKRDGKWKYYWNSAFNWKLKWKWEKAPVTQNFHNGIFTANAYVVEDIKGDRYLRVGVVFRPLRDWWFEAGIGRLFDRGEFAVKCVVMNWYSEGGIDAWDHEEGSV